MSILYIYTIILIGVVIGVLYYINWEKRIIERSKKSKEIEERLEKVQEALRIYAAENPDAAEALKRVGLL